MGLTTGAEALRAARWVNPILVHYVHFVHYVHTFDERPWTPTGSYKRDVSNVTRVLCRGC